MVTQLSTEDTFNEYRGLSTDEKPTVHVPNGSIFIEIDTGTQFLYSEDTQEWIPQEAKSGGAGGGGGVTDYRNLTGKPKINNVVLNGNITLEQLGISSGLPTVADEGDVLMYSESGWVSSPVLRNLDTAITDIGNALEGLL